MVPSASFYALFMHTLKWPALITLVLGIDMFCSTFNLLCYSMLALLGKFSYSANNYAQYVSLAHAQSSDYTFVLLLLLLLLPILLLLLPMLQCKSCPLALSVSFVDCFRAVVLPQGCFQSKRIQAAHMLEHWSLAASQGAGIWHSAAKLRTRAHVLGQCFTWILVFILLPFDQFLKSIYELINLFEKWFYNASIWCCTRGFLWLV